ncbi:hypothetical protein [Nocardiopsis sp. RV163]|uniref:hypothetical protein n=1 Tax=Nocardiopsis sp. RV163 TaxID=1661388 RepID=UPI00069ED602|nr:hypothetical protein [Nocardiopsis sp. RV163]
MDAIAQRAAELAAALGERLAPPLLLALDEVANTAPLPSLPALMSQGRRPGPGPALPAVIRPAPARQYSPSPAYRSALPLEAVQRMPPHDAWLWWRSEPPLQVETRPVGLAEGYRRVSDYIPKP